MNRSDAIASKPVPTNPACDAAPGFFTPAKYLSKQYSSC
jgi:hypothetical protein